MTGKHERSAVLTRAARWLRDLPGVLLLDVPRYVRAIAGDGDEWMSLCNRTEHLLCVEGKRGYACDWSWSSELHAPRVVPLLGRWLLSRALKNFDYNVGPMGSPAGLDIPPQVSFVIGHRGCERLPLMEMTLNSIAAQQGVSVECIVVEESTVPEVRDNLPPWVRYVHLPTANERQPFSRARVMNAGVLAARAPLVVLHDNDLVCPSVYARELVTHSQAGAEVINLKRYIFYLRSMHTWRTMETGQCDAYNSPEHILQNTTGGGSVAITKDAFCAIGGMDEDFVGWGGEDSEFWDRCETRRLWSFGYLPLLHLWHMAQPDKRQPGNPTLAMYERKMKTPCDERIRALCERQRAMQT